MNEDQFFSKENYLWMAGSFVTIILGFILMSGGASENVHEFNPEQFSFLRMNIAPTVVLLGYGFFFYAIMKKRKTSNE